MATLAAVDLNLAMCVCRDSSLVYTITIASSKGVVYSAELEPGEATSQVYLCTVWHRESCRPAGINIHYGIGAARFKPAALMFPFFVNISMPKIFVQIISVVYQGPVEPKLLPN